jgi:hypothetical protein
MVGLMDGKGTIAAIFIDKPNLLSPFIDESCPQEQNVNKSSLRMGY